MFVILKLSLEQTREEKSCQKTQGWNRQTKTDPGKRKIASFIRLDEVNIAVS